MRKRKLKNWNICKHGQTRRLFVFLKKLDSAVLTTPRRRFKGVASATSTNSLPSSPFVIPNLNLSNLQPSAPKPKSNLLSPQPPQSPFPFQSPSEIPLSPLTRRSHQNYSYRPFAVEESTPHAKTHDDETDCQQAVDVITNWKNSSLQYFSQTPRSSISTSIFSSPRQYTKPLETPKPQNQNSLDLLLQFSARNQQKFISPTIGSPLKSSTKQHQDESVKIPESKAEKLDYFSKILDAIIAENTIEESTINSAEQHSSTIKEFRKAWSEKTPKSTSRSLAKSTMLENDLKNEMVNQFLSAPPSTRFREFNQDVNETNISSSTSLLDVSSFDNDSFREQFVQDSKEVMQLITQYIKGEPEKTEKDTLPQIQKQSFRKKPKNSQTLAASFPSSNMARQLDTRFSKYLQDPDFFNMFSKYIKLFSHEEPPTEEEIRQATQQTGVPRKTDILRRNQTNLAKYSPESYKLSRSKQIEELKHRLSEAKQKHTSSWRQKLMDQEMKIARKMQKVEQFLLQKEFKKHTDIEKSKALWMSSIFGLYAFANMEKALLVQSNERVPLVYTHY